VLRELEIGSDHLIVEAIIAIPTRVLSQKKSVRTRWDREHLLQMVEEARKAVEGEEDPQPTEYAQACSRRLAGWIESAKYYRDQVGADKAKAADCIENLWMEWQKTVDEAARETIGEKVISGRRSRGFIDKEMKEEIQERRKLFKKATQSSSSEAWKSYVEKKKVIARAMFRKKRSEWDRFNAEIMQARKKNPKRYWNLLKRLDKKKSAFAATELNQSDGKPCVSNEEVLEQFTQHFATVGLNTPGAVFDREWQQRVEESNLSTLKEDDSEVSTKDHDLVGPIQAQEVADAVKDLSNGKASGRDGTFSELLKHGGDGMMEALALLFDLCRREEITPKSWHLVNIIPIFKKGDKYSKSNYRGVSLLSCVYKLYARVLQRRLTSFLNKHIVEEQAGFSAGKGCDDNLCIMTDVIERKVANREALYIALVDMRAAFDTVWRDGLWHKLEKMGVPHKLIRIIKEIYSHGKFRVVANGEEGPDVEAATAGVLQGDVLSPDLFKAFINDLPQFLENAGCTGVDISHMKKVIALMFADDILLWADTPEELQLQLDALRDYCRLWQLEVSAPKTKIILSPHAKLDSPMLYNGKVLEVVDNSAYLGVLFSGSTDFSAMIEKTLQKALGRQSALATLLTDKQLPMILRYTVWTTIVRPILEWGLEVYTPPDIGVFEAVQRKALRMIAGAQIHTPIVVLEGDFGARTMQQRMDTRKCSLIGKLKMAPGESLLGQIWGQPRRKRIRGKKTLRAEFERLEKDVLLPAGLSNIERPDGDEFDPLVKWKQSVHSRLRHLESSGRTSQVKKLSSLAHLVENGTDYSTDTAHPYTASPFGKAASLWFKIRSNTLPLGRLLAKNRSGVSDLCKCCERSVREDLVHFLCDCPALHQVRSTWISEIKSKDSKSDISLADIPKLVLGPASALQVLPYETTREQVAVVEKLLVPLWRTRNTLHFDRQNEESMARPSQSESDPKTFPPKKKEVLQKVEKKKEEQDKAPKEEEKEKEKRTVRIDISLDSHRLNANHSIDTTASGPVTRSRARLLRQTTENLVDRPCQQDQTYRAEPAPNAQKRASHMHYPAPRVHKPAPRVQKNRSARLESMEMISKTY